MTEPNNSWYETEDYSSPEVETHTVSPADEQTWYDDRSLRDKIRDFSRRQWGERGERRAEQLVGQSEEDRRMQYLLRKRGLPTVSSFGRDWYETEDHSKRPLIEKIREPSDLGAVDVVLAGLAGTRMVPRVLPTALAARTGKEVVPVKEPSKAITKAPKKETVDLARRKFLKDTGTLLGRTVLPVGKRVGEAIFTEASTRGLEKIGESLLGEKPTPEIDTSFIEAFRSWMPSSTMSVGDHWTLSMENISDRPAMMKYRGDYEAPLLDSPEYNDLMDLNEKILEEIGIDVRPEDYYTEVFLDHLTRDPWGEGGRKLRGKLAFRNLVTEDWNYKEYVDEEKIVLQPGEDRTNRFYLRDTEDGPGLVADAYPHGQRYRPPGDKPLGYKMGQGTKDHYDLMLEAGRFLLEEYGLKIDDVNLIRSDSNQLRDPASQTQFMKNWTYPQMGGADVTDQMLEYPDSRSDLVESVLTKIKGAVEGSKDPEAVDYLPGSSFSRYEVADMIHESIADYIMQHEPIATFEGKSGGRGIKVYEVDGIPMSIATGKPAPADRTDKLYLDPSGWADSGSMGWVQIMFPNERGLEKLAKLARKK